MGGAEGVAVVCGDQSEGVYWEDYGEGGGGGEGVGDCCCCERGGAGGGLMWCACMM